MFQDLFASEPDRFERNKQPSKEKPYLSSATGEAFGVLASVTVSQGRVDLSFRSRDTDLPPPESPAFSAFDAAPVYAQLDGILATCKFSIDSCYRQAINCQVFTAAENREEANEIYSRHTGLPVGPSEMDLIVQRNLRVLDTDSGLQINRLIRHEVEMVQTFSMPMMGSLPTLSPSFQPQAHTLESEDFAYVRTLDFNNHPNGQLFDVPEQLGNFRNFWRNINDVGGVNNV